MKELIKLAESKGFESYFMKVISFIPCSEHVITDPEFINHLWLCELQKWLRDEKKIYISISSELEDGNLEYYIDTFTIDRKNINWDSTKIDYTYEKVLEKGLFEALKLIKI